MSIEIEKLRSRIQGLRAKTIANGCTEAEALLAAVKVAELLDRHALSMSAAELRETPCERRAYKSVRQKRIPLDDCIGPIALFYDCYVWRERSAAGEVAYVFFGLTADVEAAYCLTEAVDISVRMELGRYKTSVAYARLRHQERHIAHASFATGMVASVADKISTMRVARDARNAGSGRDLVVLKSSILDAELKKLDLKLQGVRRSSRMLSEIAFEAGGAAGEAFSIDRALRKS